MDTTERHSESTRRGPIYKPGQGYWTRVLTAVGIGILALATGAWVYAQAELIPLPIKHWQFAVRGVQTDLPAGSAVDLRLDHAGTDGMPLSIGSATLASYTPQSGGLGSVILTGVTVTEGNDPSLATGNNMIVNGTPVLVAGAIPVRIFDQLYLQAGLAGLVLLVGAAMAFFITARNPSTSDFLIATDGEMKKVNWSTRQEIMNSTWVVIGATFVIAAVLFVIDTGFSQFFRLIGVLQK